MVPGTSTKANPFHTKSCYTIAVYCSSYVFVRPSTTGAEQRQASEAF